MKPLHLYRRLALALAGLLLLCAAPLSRAYEEIIPPHAHKLLVTDAGLVVVYSFDLEIPEYRGFWEPRGAISRDGVRWIDPYQLPNPEAVRQAPIEPLPQIQCRPDDPTICYLVDSNEQYEAVIASSADGGANWQIEFTKSANREGFRDRVADEGIASFAPQDLEIFNFPDAGYQPVVAMGVAGVWIRQLDGSWQQAEALFGAPFPPDEANWYQLNLMWRALDEEMLLISLLFGVVATVQLSILTLRRRRLAHSRSAVGWLLFTLVMANLLQVGLIALAFATFFWWYPWPIMLLLGTGASWRLLAYYQMVPDKGRLLPYQLRLLSVSALLALAPLLWWAWGVVAEYEPAGHTTIIIALGLIPINLYLFGRAARAPFAISPAQKRLIQPES